MACSGVTFTFTFYVLKTVSLIINGQCFVSYSAVSTIPPILKTDWSFPSPVKCSARIITGFTPVQ